MRREGVRRTKSFPRRTDAKAWIQELELDIYRGVVAPRPKRHMLGEAIDRYIVEVLPHKQLGTQSLHRGQLEWFKTHIGHVRLSHLTPDILAQVRESLRAEAAATFTFPCESR